VGWGAKEAEGEWYQVFHIVALDNDFESKLMKAPTKGNPLLAKQNVLSRISLGIYCSRASETTTALA
jgi:hypothetical protein